MSETFDTQSEINSIVDLIRNHLPIKRKGTPSNWISYCAPCCVHNGHSADKRFRGGIKTSPTYIGVSCFNCGFKARWNFNTRINKKFKLYLEYLGIPETEIQKLSLKTIEIEKNYFDKTANAINVDVDLSKFLNYSVKSLPKESRLITELLAEGFYDKNKDFAKSVDYIAQRNPNLFNLHPLYWSPETNYNINNRIIVPFFSDTKKIEGYTARANTGDHKVRYITDVSPRYIFNYDKLLIKNRKFVVVTEGIFDAISISGCAIMKQQMSDFQIKILQECDKQIIIVPDRDKDGELMVNQAMNLGFSVSMPNWGDNIKDVADAVANYGQIATLNAILKNRESNPTKITMLFKRWLIKE